MKNTFFRLAAAGLMGLALASSPVLAQSKFDAEKFWTELQARGISSSAKFDAAKFWE
jgi:hypothetical protein